MLDLVKTDPKKVRTLALHLVESPELLRNDGKNYYVLVLMVGKVLKTFSVASLEKIESVEQAFEKYKESIESLEPDLVFKHGLLVPLKFDILNKKLGQLI